MEHLLRFFLFTGLMLFLIHTDLFAQSPPPEVMKEVSKRKLLVIKVSPNQELMDEMVKKGHPEYVETYKGLVEDCNNNLEASFKSFYPNDFDFKTYEEAIAMSKASSGKYFVLYLETVIISTSPNSTKIERDFYWKYSDIKDGFDEIKYVQIENRYLQMSVRMIEDLDDKHSYAPYSITLPNLYPHKADIVFALQMWNHVLKLPANIKTADLKKMNRVNIPKLKNLTLLINEKTLEEKITANEIKAIYPYSFRIVSDKEFDELVFNKTPGAAYIVSFKAGVIMDCESGELITALLLPTYKLSEYSFKAISKEIESATK